MSLFRPSRSYRPDLDIRFANGQVPGWAAPLAEGQEPNSLAWLVVLPRRAGKTWLAHAVARARTASDADPAGAAPASADAAVPGAATVQVDLRSSPAAVRTRGAGLLLGAPAAPAPGPPGTVLLVDEPALAPASPQPAVGGALPGAGHPAGGGGLDPAVLAEGLARLREQHGTVPVVFVTPAEHALLAPHLGADAAKDRVRPRPLDARESARMAARAPDWAPPLVERLAEAEPGWLLTPFLLELALQTAEEHPQLRDDPYALAEAACEEAAYRHEYVGQCFHNGLAPGHRRELRERRWAEAGLAVPDTDAGTAGTGGPAGAVGTAGPGGLGGKGGPAGAGAGPDQLAGDPVLARHLPPLLRVHHVSDLHFGGRLRTNVDAKDRSQAGRQLADLAGAGTPLESYLDHVRRLGAEGRAPHLVVVTGDLVNRPRPEFGAQALDWLRQLGPLLAPHPDLRPEDPRILLAGGNHDVSWELCLDPRTTARHEWFADVFADYPHPDLHEPRHDRRRLYVRYPAAGLRIALLGTAESGGEPARDRDRERLAEFGEAFAGTVDDEQVTALIEDLERLDPGVVARGVLDRLTAEPGYTTFAALHHPLSPVPTVEVAPYSDVVNAGQAKRALAAAETALVLHGHTHQAFLAAERLLGGRTPWTTRIAGAPALASRESDEQNGYNEVLLAREGGEHTVAVRTVRFDGGQWSPEPVVAFRPGRADEQEPAALCEDAPR